MRGAVQFIRQHDRWRPVAAWLSHGDRVEVRVAPDEPDVQRVVDRLLEDGHPPLRDDGSLGDWDDWVGWLVRSMSNGIDRWFDECVPEPAIDVLYEREVAGPRQALADRRPLGGGTAAPRSLALLATALHVVVPARERTTPASGAWARLGEQRSGRDVG